MVSIGTLAGDIDPVVTDRGMTIEKHLLGVFLADCALAYRYFSLQVAGVDAPSAPLRMHSWIASRRRTNDYQLAVLRENDWRPCCARERAPTDGHAQSPIDNRAAPRAGGHRH